MKQGSQDLKFIARSDGTLYGWRHYFRVEVERDGMPGFAPTSLTYHVGDIVVSFRGDPPYFQPEGVTYLNREEVKAIHKKLQSGFVAKDFPLSADGRTSLLTAPTGAKE